jgi:c-di-GMP-binding flagellar brake protein YcgR
MKYGGPDNRKQTRYPLRTEAIVERTTGEKVRASTVNVSGGGVLLQLEQASELQVGETVTCGVRLYEQRPPQSWGTGRIVRVENSLVAIDFQNVTALPDSD